ncbi:MAG: hypothetical protein DWQ07_14590 [Chloroflexi bacterium]|nr:MAG: hypothetical protein DWQ07_14590 [Chloroflexota bacterium]MBL1195689.1 hypothetical protein [Chloroflexota bacterium]NOH12977.1 hypothetical protein [Chloroflexota bacterium]
MPSTPETAEIVGMRRKRRLARRHSASNRSASVGLAFITILSVLLAASAIGIAAGYANISQGLPSLDSLPLLFDPQEGHLLQPTRLYDRSGESVIFTLEPENAQGRNYLSLDQTTANYLPPNIVNATLAVADPGFWDHDGYTLGNLSDPANRTLAQHIATDFLLWDEEASTRKALRERLLAAQITAQFGRAKVLEWYLNSADYGNLAIGIDTAARLYFGKTAQDLTLAEAALLAAVSQAPDINPFSAPQLAVERQGQVLQAMLAQGMISTDEALNANANPLELQAPPPPPENLAPAFAELVLAQLANEFNAARIQRGGFEVITTLDIDLQSQSACATVSQLERLGQTLESPGECEAGRLLPTLSRANTEAGENLVANAVILNPNTGEILALVGDPRGGTLPQQNVGRAPGSLLSPFVYMTAFTRGSSPGSLVWDIPSSVPLFLPETLTNSDGIFHGPVSIRTALANDYLVSALGTLAQVGPENAWRITRQSGLSAVGTPFGEDAYNLLLDEGDVSLLQASHAYSTFANQGILAGQFDPQDNDSMQPVAVLQLRDYGQRVWLDWSESEARAVTSNQLAYLMTDILSDELARQESLGRPNPLEIGRPAAAKLGQTTTGDDVWAIGYSPDLLVGVWLGYSQSNATENPGELSPLTAAGLWHALMQYSHRDIPVQQWSIPAGVNTIDVCYPSGQLPTTDCPEIVSEIFISSNEPVQLDPLYRSFQINRQTGRLATVFTPPEFVEDQVYLVVPPEASEWARSAGLPIPPEDYDPVFAGADSSPEVSLLAPQVFDYVSGQVAILGSAGGENFNFYRVQVGEGLNPRQWLQVGEDTRLPVSNGELVVWDTTGFDGLYALRLVVVRQDQSIETAITQITVDNQPPEVEILGISNGDILTPGENGIVTFQAQAIDNLALASVAFYVDDELVSSLSNSPYAVAWEAEPGEHTLSVRALDQAGNQTETILTFVVEE